MRGLHGDGDGSGAVRIGLILDSGAPEHLLPAGRWHLEPAAAVQRFGEEERGYLALMLVGAPRVPAQVRARERLREPPAR